MQASFVLYVYALTKMVHRQVWRHKLGSPPGEDKLVYEETDDSFYISIYRSRSEQLLLIQAGTAHPTLSLAALQRSKKFSLPLSPDVRKSCWVPWLHAALV